MATARKLQSGNWRVRVHVGNGKYKSITASTKKEAELLAAQLVFAQKEKPLSITFGEAIERYISSKSNVLKPSTINGYRIIQRNYIGSLSNVVLRNITTEKLQWQINQVAKEHAPKTVNNVKGLITATLAMFMPDRNFHISIPSKEKKQRYVPTDEEIARLLSVARNTDMELPIMLACFGSLRRAEIAGLMEDCVYKDHISIRRVYDKGPDNIWKLMNSPKTSAGNRDIYLPEEIMDKLHVYIKEHPDHKYGIFGMNPDMIYKRLQTLIKKAEITQFGVHALRHYFATYMHEVAPDKYIAKIGGWDDINTLQRIYEHTTSSRMQKVETDMSVKYDVIKNMTQNMTRNS